MRHLIEIVSSSVPSSPVQSDRSTLREYLEYLLENQRVDYLMKTYGTKVLSLYQAELATTPAEVQAAIQGQPVEDEARKIIDYIASFDPSPDFRYAQWLVTRWIKNGFLLEDLPQARQELDMFNRFKGRLQQKDLNAYPTLPALATVLVPFAQPGAQTELTSARSEKRALAIRMSTPPEANIIYNDEQIKIVHPMTEAASCYWGQNTKWCTAATKGGPVDQFDGANQFASYNARGPLYIVLIKAKNQRYQFQFTGSTTNSYFMNELDKPIDLGALLREYPVIFTAFGEERFLPYASQIGLSWFKKIDASWIAGRNVTELGNAVYTKDDLDKIPDNVQRLLDFQKGLVQGLARNGGVEKRAQLINLLPEDYYKDHLADLIKWIFAVVFAAPAHLITPGLRKVAIVAKPTIFSEFPPEWQTQELANFAAQLMIERNAYAELLNAIPEKWRDAKIMDEYWKARTAKDRNLRLKDLPHSYWNDATITNLMKLHPEDMKEHVGALNDTIVRKVCADHMSETHFFDKVPAEFFTEGLLSDIKRYDAAHPNVGGRTSLYVKFPPKTWDKETLMSHDGVKKLTDLNTIKPEFLHDPEVIDSFVMAHPEQTATIPANLFTDDALKKLFIRYDYNEIGGRTLRSIFQTLADRKLISQDLLVSMATTEHTSDSVFRNIPESLRTSRVMRTFAEHGNVPIKELPEALQTPEIIERRFDSKYGSHSEEVRDVPAKFQTPEFMVRLAEKNPQVVTWVPANLRTEPLLWIFLNNIQMSYRPEERTYSYRNFNEFPKDTWSNRTVALAIDKGLLSGKDEYYEQFSSPEVAAAIVIDNPDNYAKYADVLSTTEKVAIAGRNPNFLLQLDPAHITEPMVNAAMEAVTKGYYFRQGRYQGIELNPELIGHLPRKVFSKRIYAMMAGKYVALKDIPQKFQDDEMRRNAIKHTPFNVLALKEPTTWMNQHYGKIDPKASADWLFKMEKVGFIWTRKGGWVDVRTLPKQPLSTGYSVAVQEVKVNKRVYLFSPKGEFVLFLYTLKDEVHLSNPLDAAQIKKLRPSIIELCDKFLKDFKVTNLNKGLYIYKAFMPNGGRVQGGEDLMKDRMDELQYTYVNHGEGYRMVVYLGNQQIVSFTTNPPSKGMFGRRGDPTLDLDTIYDYPKVLEHGPTLDKLLDKRFGYYKFDRQLKNVGVIISRDGKRSGILTEKKVGRVGDLAVYRTADTSRIGVFNLAKKDIAASARIKKNGGLYDIDTGWRYGDTDGGKIQATLQKIEQYLRKTKNVAGEIAFDKP